MKENRSTVLNRPAKRPRTDKKVNGPVPDESIEALTNVKSVHEQAEPYRICTVKFPTDALTSSWSVGSNRPVDDKHVLSLCRIFEGDGLQREFMKNHLMVGCTEEQVRKMRLHFDLMHDGSTWPNSLSGPWPSFEAWMAVNGQKAEIISGQHRVEALGMFLERNGKRLDLSENDERWWICDVYDLDKLPQQLKIKLRANRHDHTLLDSHAHIWMELVTLAASDPTLFQGTGSKVREEMLSMLGLNGQFKFPIRRLVTLWKNTTWQPVVTEWCRTTIGHSTFNISTWEELARYRIDDFWFDVIEEVREWVLLLCDDDLQSIQLTDWTIFVRLSSPRQATEIDELFYPGAPPEALVDLEAHGGPYRKPKFLVALTDAVYYNAYQAVWEFPDRRFPDIQTILRTSRRDGKALSQVICHVVQWLNPSPTKLGDRENNKPPLWRDLIKPLSFGSSSQGETEGRARELQRRIFDVLRDRVDEISESYLSTMSDTAGESYLDRFDIPIWRDILVTVHSITGPRFQGTMAKFNQQDPVALPSQQESTLVPAVSKALGKIPEIARNPALRSKQAMEALMSKISPIISSWASKQCREALRGQKLGLAAKWPPSVLEFVAAELEKLDKISVDSAPLLRTLPWPQSIPARRTLPSNSPEYLPSSPPMAQPEEFQVTSPAVSESVTDFQDPGAPELPQPASPKPMSLEMDEAELMRRRRKHRQPSKHVSLPQNRKSELNHQETLPSVLPETAKAISADRGLVSSVAAPIRPMSNSTRSWKRSPAAQPKLTSDIKLPPHQRSHI